MPPAAPSFPSCRKRWGRKGALGYVWCFLHLSLGKSQCFSLAFHTRVTLRASWYAPPDTGVSDLQLVALERLPSIEGAAEILMDITFSRGLCRGGALLRPLAPGSSEEQAGQSPAPTRCVRSLYPRLTAPLAARGATFSFPCKPVRI